MYLEQLCLKATINLTLKLLKQHKENPLTNNKWSLKIVYQSAGFF